MTVLTPESDSRDADVRDFDEFQSRTLATDMNATEKLFQQRLIWQKLPILQLLATSPPFCELDYDAVKPQILTSAEKTILREYLTRGGFIELSGDTYPYSQDVFWAVKKWPVIDFVTRELPAFDSHFTFKRITEKHLLFHLHYTTQIDEAERHELEGNPYTPDFILVSYRGHPCAFVWGNYGRYYQNRWMALERPFDRNLRLVPEDYALNVNLYIYAMTH